MNKIRVVESLNSVIEILEKCGGPGSGRPGPCPGGGRGGGKKPPDRSPIAEQARQERVQSVHSRFASILGRSPGGKDSFRDRIEGTSKEVAWELKRANKAVTKAKKALAKAEKKQSANDPKIKAYKETLVAIDKKQKALSEESKGIQTRMAGYRAQLEALRKKKSKETELTASIMVDLKRLEQTIKGLKNVTSAADNITKALSE